MKGVAALLLPLLLAGCSLLPGAPATDNTAVAELKDASGSDVGVANFTQVGSAVRIDVSAKGLPPGQHGVHIHDVGKCDPPAFTSAGGHFNPGRKQHGAMNPQGWHAGDLPNLTINPDGTGRLQSASEQVTLRSGTTSLFDADGSALVIHAQPDDFRTDPTGNSGARIACGVIVKAPPKREASSPTKY